MFQTKNLSPRKLSALTALVLSIPISLGIYLLQGSWIAGVVAFVLIFLGSYLLIFNIIQNFIYRKIKLIYKFIHQTKATRREEMYYKYILPQKSIDDVREDVEAWAKQQSRELDVLKQNEAYRKEFLQNLSHEFKTPVFAIQGYIDTLLDGALENPEVNRRFLEKAGKNARRLANLINDLDAISKLERGELKLSKQNFVIQDVIREAFESLFINAESANIDFSFKKGCEKPMAVYADKEKIQQVVYNLIDNAIKYGKPDGHIVASIYNTDDKTVLVEISDNGIGIPEKYLNRIFERFYRTSGGRNKEVKGSGLGLSICKHIIEAHSQTIHVRSKEDVGTTVGFTLDRKKEAWQ
ncbi:MAG: HAMP domain-containing histidine kinase [Bacteroidota bacterium]|nr:HAMP domain-containing histidine kinase [Bacteroidota bacterium]